MCFEVLVVCANGVFPKGLAKFSNCLETVNIHCLKVSHDDELTLSSSLALPYRGSIPLFFFCRSSSVRRDPASVIP